MPNRATITYIFDREIKSMKNELHSVPSEYRSYIVNEQVSRKIRQLRRIKKRVLANIE